MKREEILKIYADGPEAIVDLVQGLIREFTAVIEKQSAEIHALKERVKSLENQLNQNNRNSNKPPSSDGFKKPNPKSLRGKSDKPTGGQQGHNGYRLELRNVPDHVITHSVSSCQKCCRLLEHVPSQSYERRQVFDLVARIEVTEHRAEAVCCPDCNHVNQAAFPDEVPCQTQYGHHLKAFVSYWDVYQLIPSERLRELVFDLTGHSISEGTLYNTNAKLYKQLDSYEEQVKEQLLVAPVLHCDESGLRVLGKNNWFHNVSTNDLTYYTVHGKRGQEGMDAAGILPSYQGISVHDGWASYWSYTQCQHALCNVHHERELRAVIENDRQTWAQDMIDLLHEIKNTVEATVISGLDRLDAGQITQFKSKYDTIIRRGMAENPLPPPPKAKKRGKIKKSKTRNLLERLDQNRGSVLLFMNDFQVPYTNNQVEQDVRMIKVQQKISGTFRSLEGAQTFCRVRGYISTLKKQGLPVMEYIRRAFEGKPFMQQWAKS